MGVTIVLYKQSQMSIAVIIIVNRKLVFWLLERVLVQTQTSCSLSSWVYKLQFYLLGTGKQDGDKSVIPGTVLNELIL